VGDSRVYVMRRGALEQVTSDHSWVEEQVRAGTMTPTAARQHPWRNVVTRALSGGTDPDIDTIEIAPKPGECASAARSMSRSISTSYTFCMHPT